jgi:hypothetical protein
MNLRRNNRRGSFLLEFALAAAFVMIPLVLGAATIGTTLVRTLHVYQFNRDMGHMLARGVDFSQAQNRALLVRMANGLDISDVGGSGVVILSTIQCVSAGQAYCIRRVVVGNAALRTSAFSSPTLIDSAGNVDIVRDPHAGANPFLAVMTMSPGETAYVSESYFGSADYDWTGFLTGNGTYTRAVF